MEDEEGRNGAHSYPTVSLGQAREIIKTLAAEQSILLISPPGVGKTEMINSAAAEAGLPCTSILGSQIAPEDIIGIPRIVGERSVFCPPRTIVPENPEQRFCLFLDEFTSCQLDVQRSLHPLLLERRVGEYKLPKGCWIVSAGNRMEDKALVRSFSSALTNRVLILHLHVDVGEWLSYAEANNVRQDIRAFISFLPEALMRPAPMVAGPFSTPRSWVALSKSLDLAEEGGCLSDANFEVIVYGRVSPKDAAVFIAARGIGLCESRPLEEYIRHPRTLPEERLLRWCVFSQIRRSVAGGLDDTLHRLPADVVSAFFSVLSPEDKAGLLLGLVDEWMNLGLGGMLVNTLCELSVLNRGNL